MKDESVVTKKEEVEVPKPPLTTSESVDEYVRSQFGEKKTEEEPATKSLVSSSGAAVIDPRRHEGCGGKGGI